MEPHRDSLRSPGFVSPQTPAGASSKGPGIGPGPAAGATAGAGAGAVQGRDRLGRRVEAAPAGRFTPVASSRMPGPARDSDGKPACPLRAAQVRIDAALGGLFDPAPGTAGPQQPGSPEMAARLRQAVAECGATQLSVAAVGHLMKSLLARDGLAGDDLRRGLSSQDLVPLGEALARGVSSDVMTVVRVDQLARHVRALAPRLTLEALVCLTLGLARAPGKVAGRDDALWAPLARRIAAEIEAPQDRTDPRWGGLLELLDQVRDDLEDADLSDAQRAHLQARLTHVSGLIEKALLPGKEAPGLDAKHAGAGPAAGSPALACRAFEAFLASPRASGDGARTRQASRVLALSLGGRAMPVAVRNQCLDAWRAAVRALPRQADHQPLVEALCGFVHGALKGPDGRCEALEAWIGRLFAGSAPAPGTLRSRWLEDLSMMVLALLKALAMPSLEEPALRRFLEALGLPGDAGDRVAADDPDDPDDQCDPGVLGDGRRWMTDSEAGFLLEQVARCLCKASPGPFPADVLLAWLGQAQGPATRLHALGRALGEALAPAVEETKPPGSGPGHR